MRHALDIGEAALLEEKSYRMTDKGKVKDGLVYLKFEQNVRFVFAAVAKAYGLTFELRKDGSEWKALLIGVEIRSRLTHPKVIESMTVSDFEMEIVRGAGEWFMAQALALLTQILAREEQLLQERGTLGALSEWYNPLRGLGLDALLPSDEQMQAQAELRAIDELLNSSSTMAADNVEEPTATGDD